MGSHSNASGLHFPTHYATPPNMLREFEPAKPKIDFSVNSILSKVHTYMKPVQKQPPPPPPVEEISSQQLYLDEIMKEHYYPTDEELRRIESQAERIHRDKTQKSKAVEDQLGILPSKLRPRKQPLVSLPQRSVRSPLITQMGHGSLAKVKADLMLKKHLNLRRYEEKDEIMPPELQFEPVHQRDRKKNYGEIKKEFQVLKSSHAKLSSELKVMRDYLKELDVRIAKTVRNAEGLSALTSIEEMRIPKKTRKLKKKN